MSPLQETAVVLGHELRRSLRSAKSLVLLLLYALASVLSGLVFVGATRLLQGELAAAGVNTGQITPEMLLQAKKGGLSMLFGKGDDALLASLVQVPLVVLFFFKFTLFFLPLLIALMGFDQISGELQQRSLRYVTFRVGKGPILAGKVLAQLLSLLALTALVNLGMFAYTAATTEGVSVGAGVVSLLRFWALEVVYAAPFLGLVALLSASFRTPIYALLGAFCALFVCWMLWLLPAIFSQLAPLAYLSPLSYEAGLYHPSASKLLPSLAFYLLTGAAALGLAYLMLRTRDI